MSASILKSTILELISDVKENVSRTQDEKADMMLVEFFFNRLHPELVQQNVIKAVLPHKTKIENRDEDFFLENKFLFSGLPQDRLEYYMEKIKSDDYIDKDNRKVIYDYLDLIIKIAENNKKSV